MSKRHPATADPTVRGVAVACFESGVAASDAGSVCNTPECNEARNLSVSGPRGALARGEAAVYDGPPEPSPGQCCSAMRVSVRTLTSERVTLEMRASMVAKRQFMSVPPSALRLRRGPAARSAPQSLRALAYKLVEGPRIVNPDASCKVMMRRLSAFEPEAHS